MNWNEPPPPDAPDPEEQKEAKMPDQCRTCTERGQWDRCGYWMTPCKGMKFKDGHTCPGYHKS